MDDRTEPRQITHSEGCWSWGPAHYLCAYRQLGNLRLAALAALEALEDAPYMSNKDDHERLDRVTRTLRAALGEKTE